MLDDKVKIHFEVEQLLYIEYMAQQNKKKCIIIYTGTSLLS